MIMVLAAQLHIFISRPSQELSNELMLLVDKQSAHKHNFLVHICLRQASNLDLFSATQPNEFAETLSFLLEF